MQRAYLSCHEQKLCEPGQGASSHFRMADLSQTCPCIDDWFQDPCIGCTDSVKCRTLHLNAHSQSISGTRAKDEKAQRRIYSGVRLGLHMRLSHEIGEHAIQMFSASLLHQQLRKVVLLTTLHVDTMTHSSLSMKLCSTDVHIAKQRSASEELFSLTCTLRLCQDAEAMASALAAHAGEPPSLQASLPVQHCLIPFAYPQCTTSFPEQTG